MAGGQVFLDARCIADFPERFPTVFELCRKHGLATDMMETSFFIGRETLVACEHTGLPRWQDNIFIWMSRNAGNPADFFRLPAGRVIEMGAQVLV